MYGLRGNGTTCVDDYDEIDQYDADNLISVGAFNEDGEKRAKSNYGDGVNIFAPGGNIYSTVPGGYGYKSGTSMAAPHITGLAALLCSIDSGLDGSELKELILEGSEDFAYSVSSNLSETYSSVRASASETMRYYFEDNEPEFLSLNLVGKDDDGWQVELINNNNFAVFAAYNSKMCFSSAAKSFSGISDIMDTVIAANSSEIVTISENGTAGYITSCIGYNFGGSNYRLITYANGLSKSGTSYSMNAL